MKIFLAVIMNLAATSSGLLLMAASAWLITSASFHPPLSTLAIGITIVRAAGLFRAIFRYAERYLTHTVIFETLTKIRLNIYEISLNKLPLKSGETAEGELLHDLTVNADLIKDYFARVIQPFLCTSIITAIVTIYLFKAIGILSLILPLSMIISLMIIYAFSTTREINDTHYREVLLDLSDGQDEIFTFDSTSIAINKLNEESKIFGYNEQSKRNKIINIETVCNLVNVVALVVILNELIVKVDIINRAMWLFILLLLFESFTILPSVVRNFIDIKLRIKFDRSVNQVVLNNDSKNPDVAIKINNLNFGYIPGINVIENLNLEVKHGEKIAIVGESGSGKTTLLYLMVGLWPPDSGNIYVSGKISISTTNNYIFSTSIRENFLILYPEIAEEKILDSLKICQLKNFSLDEELGENGSRLSGGERCRLQTALAIGSDSEILILDEPTAGLDRITAKDLINEILIDTNKRDRTLIMITHDLSIAKMMDRIFNLR